MVPQTLEKSLFVGAQDLCYISKMLTLKVRWGNKLLLLLLFNPRTHTQTDTPTVVQGGGGGWNPSPEFLICCSISK